MCLCVFLLNPFLTFLFTSHPFFCFRLCGRSLLLLLLSPSPSSLSFNVLTSFFVCALLSPSFNLSSLCPSQSQSHQAFASYSSFYPQLNLHSAPHFPLVSNQQRLPISSSCRSFFSLTILPLCFSLVCVHVYIY